MFSWNVCEIFQNSFLTEHFWMTASAMRDIVTFLYATNFSHQPQWITEQTSKQHKEMNFKWVKKQFTNHAYSNNNQKKLSEVLYIKKTFLKILQNSQENSCTRVSFLIKLQAEVCNFIKKETLAQMPSCEFCCIFKNTFFYRTSPL